MLNLSIGGGVTVIANGTVLTVNAPNEKPAVLNYTTDRQAELMARVMAKQLHGSNADFALSLTGARNPSTKQMYWVDEMLKRARENEVKASQPTPALPTLDTTKIVELFEHARQALKRPKITLILDIANPSHLVRLSYDVKRGVIWLNSESFGQNYGLIDLTSKTVKLKQYGNQNRNALLTLLNEFAQDPITMAIAHGKLTGNCMFCQLKLSDERSLHHGYGKRCARNYGLVWGERPNLSAVTHWSLGDK